MAALWHMTSAHRLYTYLPMAKHCASKMLQAVGFPTPQKIPKKIDEYRIWYECAWELGIVHSIPYTHKIAIQC